MESSSKNYSGFDSLSDNINILDCSKIRFLAVSMVSYQNSFVLRTESHMTLSRGFNVSSSEQRNICPVCVNMFVFIVVPVTCTCVCCINLSFWVHVAWEAGVCMDLCIVCACIKDCACVCVCV